MTEQTTASSPPADLCAHLAARFGAVRQATLDLTQGLTAEDQQVQSMADVSPTKWHLAHTTWFFETFLLAPHLPDYKAFDPAYVYLFNSYYETIGERHPRPQRGLLTRPGLEQVLAYRRHVDASMSRLIDNQGETHAALIELGLHHEQQHQELILMDIKHVFWSNPLRPAYGAGARSVAPSGESEWLDFDGGLREIGHAGGGFAFDNEGPRHKVWLEPYRLAARLVTNREYLQFIRDGGYRRPEYWLSDGWATVNAEGWLAPLYWQAGQDDDAWRLFTHAGLGLLPLDAPVQHLSYFEAEAFAAWAGRRLPTEAEWEAAAQDGPPGLEQMIGVAWQWTASAYLPYPRYRAPEGAIGEYNGKFMSGQMVLRGGAAETPDGHLRISYRNFFPPAARWAFSGLRLADDA